MYKIYQSNAPVRGANVLDQLTFNKFKNRDHIREPVGRFLDIIHELKDMVWYITIISLYYLQGYYECFRCIIESRDDLPKLEALRIKIIEEKYYLSQKN